MTWLIAILCFVVGLCIGAVLFKQLFSDGARVEELEEKLTTLQSEHDHYKNNVHAHFSDSAQLVNKLTDSYREVYRHLAAGAQSLCPESISSQLSLSAQSQDLIPGDYSDQYSGEYSENYEQSLNMEDPSSLNPPRDYADKPNPEQKGTLAEDYGLEKRSPIEEPGETPNRVE
jgi:uncharacterized protein